jgi:hypothetical protein
MVTIQYYQDLDFQCFGLAIGHSSSSRRNPATPNRNCFESLDQSGLEKVAPRKWRFQAQSQLICYDASQKELHKASA